MRRDLVAAALLLRFLLELALFAVLGWWGWATGGVLLAVAAVAVAVAAWGVLLSPRAPVRLAWPVRAAVEALAWAAGAAALVGVGRPGLSLALVGMLLVDLAVLVPSGEWRRPGSTHALG